MNLSSQDSVHLVTPTLPYCALFKGTQMFFSVNKEVIAQTCKTVKSEDGILDVVFWLEQKFHNKDWFVLNNYIMQDWYPAYSFSIVFFFKKDIRGLLISP